MAQERASECGVKVEALTFEQRWLRRNAGHPRRNIWKGT
jgi:hypothetical protein